MFDLLLLVRPSKTTQGFSWKNELLTLPKANEGLIRLTLTSTTLTSLTKPKATISQSDWNRMGHDFKKKSVHRRLCMTTQLHDKLISWLSDGSNEPKELGANTYLPFRG